MTLAISLHDNLDEIDGSDVGNFRSTANNQLPEITVMDLPRLSDKLRVPEFNSLVSRPRLHEMLERSTEQYGATLISGRAGTGKTALASDFAREKNNTAWYSIDPTDIEWGVFSHYFSECINGSMDKERIQNTKKLLVDVDLMPGNIAEFLTSCFSKNASASPSLIVLDNIHHVFDADWFCDFFNLLIASMNPDTHLLMLCRSRPPAPLWRLRSKQMLNVIDEKLLAFTVDETREFFKMHNLPEGLARPVYNESFGRISKIMQFVNLTD
jgi:ATP/maltotriose-dependent transcriptional regulator MalT